MFAGILMMKITLAERIFHGFSLLHGFRNRRFFILILMLNVLNYTAPAVAVWFGVTILRY